MLDDEALLREQFDVRTFWFEARGGLSLARRAAAQAQWLQREGPGAAFVLAWFADYPAALPVRWARRHSVPVGVVVGGFDAARLPDLGYGVFASAWRAPLARHVLRSANVVLPVADSLLDSANRFAGDAPSRQGLRAHVENMTTPVEVIPTGYRAASWPAGPPTRAPSVLTVAHLPDARTLRVKGIDWFLHAAQAHPAVPFRIVGVSDAVRADLTGPSLPTNVTLSPPVPRDRLPAVYQAASVYAQLSRTEGLPNVLCEAMLSGCAPVVTDVGAMAEVVGEAGVVASSPDAVVGCVGAAIRQADAVRASARARIVETYSRDLRRQRLVDVIERLATPASL